MDGEEDSRMNKTTDLCAAETPELTAARLNCPEDCGQLFRLENGFLREIGEPCLDAPRMERLERAAGAGRIVFFLAWCGDRAVGMCSVSPCFSTYACADIGVFDDFYVEPAYRKRGAARLLVRTAECWCRENGLASMIVGASDEAMYKSLGFTTELGPMLAHPV